MPAPTNIPRISVVVPTYGRPERVRALLDRLDAQTLPVESFEVILVDDGSPVPIVVAPNSRRCDVRVLRQANAGPGSARNRGVEIARAELVIFLNDDAVPASNLLEAHLKAHADAAPRTAVMGTFPFTANALQEPFTQVLANTDLLFQFSGLRHGAYLNWIYFWTCNISLPRSILVEVGGFDTATFREAIVEDVELGYRLEKLGWRVLYREDAICEHEHVLQPDDYFRRSERLGANVAKMWRKHRDPSVLWQKPDVDIDREFRALQQLRLESFHRPFHKIAATLRSFCAESRGKRLQSAECRKVGDIVRDASMIPFARGFLREYDGVEPLESWDRDPSFECSVSIIVCSYDALAKTKNCIDSLRRTVDPERRIEILVVDNGSSDGSAEWLAEQPDLVLIANTANLGAPRARNQALARAKGDYLVFLDNDIVLTPGWLERMIHHAEVDPRTGCVGARADRASHGQEMDYDGATDFESLAAYARRQGFENDRRASVALTLASFLILVKRAVIERIGGFDECFSPWGFEDDDLTLRIHVAGWTNRIAHDVFVHHDTYMGPKLERHNELLEANWVKFCRKWDLGERAYGQLGDLARHAKRSFAPEQLYCSIVPEPLAALPNRSVSHASIARLMDVQENPVIA